MNKISVEAAIAFAENKDFKRSNTLVNIVAGQRTMWIYGNPIATTLDDGTIEISHQGCPTPTTRNRINAVLTVIASKWRMRTPRGQPQLQNLHTSRRVPFPAQWIAPHLLDTIKLSIED